MFLIGFADIGSAKELNYIPLWSGEVICGTFSLQVRDHTFYLRAQEYSCNQLAGDCYILAGWFFFPFSWKSLTFNTDLQIALFSGATDRQFH